LNDFRRLMKDLSRKFSILKTLLIWLYKIAQDNRCSISYLIKCCYCNTDARNCSCLIRERRGPISNAIFPWIEQFFFWIALMIV
jgi:hypothetical protein